MLTLADAIIEERFDLIKNSLEQGESPNGLDQYGFTPLIEAAIVNNVAIAELLIKYGAQVNEPDAIGGTALHWAAENNNFALCELLLQHGANPNAYNVAGQPVLVMPLLRQQQDVKKLLLEQGASLVFAQDYVNAKQLGHMFELIGTADILDPENNFVEVNFEGFFLEVSLAMIMESLAQFNNHFAARQMRSYVHLIQIIVESLAHAGELSRFQHYRANLEKHQNSIQKLIAQEPLIIPVAYEGHAITFIKLGRILVKCDRREDSRMYDNVMIYQINRPEVFNQKFIQGLIYENLPDEFINSSLPAFLELEPITEIKISAQVSGNCSWANVEACLPALFFLLVSGQEEGGSEHMMRDKNIALKFFNQWREWNKDRALQFCIQSFREANPLRKACKAEILAAILFQTCNDDTSLSEVRAERILSLLIGSAYEHVLQNYVKAYCFEDHGEEGKNFLKLLKKYGFRF